MSEWHEVALCLVAAVSIYPFGSQLFGGGEPAHDAGYPPVSGFCRHPAPLCLRLDWRGVLHGHGIDHAQGGQRKQVLFSPASPCTTLNCPRNSHRGSLRKELFL